MHNIYKQGDLRWSSKQLGHGNLFIGGHGCLLTCLAMANEIFTGAVMTPHVANLRGKNFKGSFSGSLAVVPKLAEALSIEALPRVTGTPDVLWQEICRRHGCRALWLVHVDHKSDSRGDHWVLAHDASQLAGLAYLDPATGADGVLSFPSLTGPTVWRGVRKKYEARAVQTLLPMV